jgi:hypothetical protein
MISNLMIEAPKSATDTAMASAMTLSAMRLALRR